MLNDSFKMNESFYKMGDSLKMGDSFKNPLSATESTPKTQKERSGKSKGLVNKKAGENIVLNIQTNL